MGSEIAPSSALNAQRTAERNGPSVPKNISFSPMDFADMG